MTSPELASPVNTGLGAVLVVITGFYAWATHWILRANEVRSLSGFCPGIRADRLQGGPEARGPAPVISHGVGSSTLGGAP